VPYSIRVRRSGDTEQYLKLGQSFNDARIDLYSFMNDYLSNTIPSISDFANTLENLSEEERKIYEDSNRKHVFTIESRNFEEETINGTFRVGYYGYSAPLLDIKTGDIAHTKSCLEAELSPYYFLMKVKPDSDIGIVILQAFNNLGVKDLFFNGLYDSFRSKYSDYVVEMHSYMPKGIIKQYLQNRIIEIKLVKFGYPKDIMNIPMDDLPEQDSFEGTSELVIKPPIRKDFPDKFLDKFRNSIDDFLGDSDSSIGSIIEVQNFKYDTAKVKVKHGNSDRTVDLINTGRLKYSQELDGKVKINSATGFPKFDSIDELAKEFMDEIALSIWGNQI
jgi:hypothetical protein